MARGTRGHVLVAAGRRRGELLRGTALHAALLALAAPAAAQPAPGAQPQGGRVVAGAASIAQTATATTISQSSPRAAITWGSFDVGRDQSVTFQQPSASAVTLNSVTGGADPSAIAGRISANGQVVITNQNGVVFYPGAEVNAQGVVASAAGIGARNFMAGRMAFDRPAHPNARVVNQGSITVRQAGLAALVAPQVANSGTITARMGRVVLAGAETHTLDLYGDGLLSLDVTGKVRQVPRGPDGKPVTALVTNTGAIAADGGTVTLTAAAADGIVQDLVSAGGRIRANTAGGQPGRVVIAGTGGSVSVTGRVSADGTAPGESGGTVVVNATGTVTAASGARISASGMAGGGTVAFGTTLARAAGGSAVTGQPTAARAVVQRGARIAANARRRGHGGQVTVLSAGRTTLAGTVSARGGRQGGDGGSVEASGNTLGLTGTITAAAPQGRLGTILLDPTELTIAASGGNAAPGTGDPNIASADPPADAVVTATALESLEGAVHLQAADTITVATSVTFTGAQPALWLDAQNRIVVNAGAAIAVPGASGAPGQVRLTAGSGGILLNGSLSTGALQFETPGAVSQGPGSAVTVTDLWGNAGSVSLTSRLNQIAGVGQDSGTVEGNFSRFRTTAGDFSLTDGVALAVGNDGTRNGISVPAGRAIALVTDGITVAAPGTGPAPLDAANGMVSIAPFTAGRPVELVGESKTPGALSLSTQDLSGIGAGTLALGSASAGPLTIGADGGYIYDAPSTLTLRSGASIGQVGGFSASTLVASAPTVNLPSANNLIGALGGAAASGDVAVTSGEPMVVTGPVSGANVSLTTYGDLGLGADVTAPGTLALTTYPLSLESAPPPSGSRGYVAQGAITQSAGTITAGTLVAAAVGGVTLPSATNAIGQVGDVAAGGSIALGNGPQPLAVTGALSAGPSSTLSITTGGDLALAATSTLTSDTEVSLAASGAITQAQGSSIATPMLMGRGASASLTSAANRVDALLGFATTAGGFALTDGTALTVSADNGVTVPGGQAIALVADQLALKAPLSAPSGTVALAPLTVGRPVALTASGTADSAALSLQQADLGQITAGTLRLGSADAGPITLGNPGDLISFATVGTLDLVSGGAVAEPGRIAVGTLEGSARSASLDGSNAVGTLAGFTTQGVFSLTDGQSLRVAGPVAGGALVALSAAGDLALGGNLSASGTVRLDATGTVTQPGGSVGAGILTGSAGSFALTQPGNSVAAVGALASDGGVALADGRSLTVSGAVTAGEGGTLALAVAGDLAIQGAISGPGVVALNVAGALSEPGSLAAGTLEGSAGSAALLGRNGVGVLGDFATRGGFALADGRSLAVGGTVTDPASIALSVTGDLALSGVLSAPGVSLAASGAISQPGGRVAAGTLAGSAASVSLGQPGNAVAALGAFTSAGDILLADASPLAVAGAVRAGGVEPALTIADDAPTLAPGGSLAALGGTIALRPVAPGDALVLAGGGVPGIAAPITAGTLRIGDGAAGPVTIAAALDLGGVGALDLESGGAVAESGAGAVAVGTLTGRAASASLTGPNGVGTLGGFATGGAFALSDAQPLVVAGPLSAASIAVTAPGSITLAGGTIAAPSSDFEVLAGPGGTGTLTQAGATTVLPPGGGIAALRLGLPAGGGALTLNDLQAGAADVVLATGTGGTASGTIDANTLLVIGQGGSASLSGTVQGQGGAAAAAVSRIGQFNVLYQLNGCPIEAASCLPLAPPQPPSQPAEPVVNLQEVDLDGSLIEPMRDRVRPELLTLDPFPLILGVAQDLDDPEFLLPNISDRDY